MDYLFYDIEVFKFDSLVVFMDITGEEIAHFWNKNDTDDNGFTGVLPLIKGNTLVGYNNHNYDDKVLSMMIRGADQATIKAVNDSIIRGDKVTVVNHPDMHTLDCFQQIDVSRPGLKTIEANMGVSIIESDIDFNHPYPLTEEEKEIVLQYCRYDVLNTIEVFKMRKSSYFDVKDRLLEDVDGDREKMEKWNTTTISANILMGNSRMIRWNRHKVPMELWRNIDGIPDEVWTMWETATDINASDEVIMGKGVSCKIDAFSRPGVPFEVTFGIGGLHGATKKPTKFSNVLLADVGSMYPSIICKLNALDSATEKYNNLRLERLSIKHKDKTRADALKLVLNSVYGNFKSQFSSLYCPRASATICIFGQIALFDLAMKLYKAGYNIVNLNTDGVAFTQPASVACDYSEILDMWERKFEGLTLEIDKFTTWIQKDVNNYIAVTPERKIKVKGGDCKKYHSDSFFTNNSLRIVHIALVDKLVYGKSVTRSVIDHLNDPYLYQIILKAGSTYKGVADKDMVYQQKVNRIFAAAEDVPYTKLYKVRKDDGLVNFPDVPERMYIHNGDCKDLDLSSIIDIQYYVDLIEKKLKGWEMT